MIITRAPLRITLGGGGTDLPSYYRRFGGELVSAGIDKYIYIALHRMFQPGFVIKYSSFERVDRAESIKHPIFREALQGRKIEPQVEMVSFADIPDGTGLGSSGAFTVALLKALSCYRRENKLTRALAEEACDIEINRLLQPIGKQDQFACAYGGITHFKFNPDESVEVSPLNISHESLERLEDNLLLFFTGFSRSASEVLSDQKTKTETNDGGMIENLHFTKKLGQDSKTALEEGDLRKFAEFMNVHWENKKRRTKGMSNGAIDRAYQVARDNGAVGGKLIGAGAGGFLLVYTEDHARLRKAMQKEQLQEVRFRFDFEGVRLIS
ncbi:MAG: galactokinase [Bdellovibrio sp.]|nr:MAG: galactokinase [Bdellovibrio sp.]